MKRKIFEKKIEGVDIKVEFNDFAKYATNSVWISAGDTVVFVSVVDGGKDYSTDYFPLSVEFEEKFYSIGSILGSRFMRREGRPSDNSVLNGRIVDRTIRPLFPDGFKNQIQVIISTISFGKYNPDALSIIGTSIALSTSNIPWGGPISGIRLTKKNDKWYPFAPFKELSNSDANLLICGNEKKITMIEMEGNEIDEEEVKTETKKAMTILKDLQLFQKDIEKEMAVKKNIFEKETPSSKIKNLFEKEIQPKLKDFVANGLEGDVYERWKEIIKNEIEDKEEIRLAEDTIKKAIDDEVHNLVINENTRISGRKLDEIREIYTQAGGISSILHGSGIFFRGDTRILSVITLGGPEDSLLDNSVENPDLSKRFFHHYNFPPFSTGEVGRLGGTKRREIGHGALVEKALTPIIPNEIDFPYTIRIVSECISSSGSTSMGSTCASTLALMDAGVPIKKPVAGIAMGVFIKGDKYKVVTDIEGKEDHHGDMDLKIAGTKDGITAMQMDVKVDGIVFDIFENSLIDAKVAREKILNLIEQEIKNPRDSLSDNVPQIKQIQIPVKDIGLVIGGGGSTIKEIKEKSGVDGIDIKDDGTISLTGSSEAIQKAMDSIKIVRKDFEIGEKFEGIVKDIRDFGAFVEIHPGVEGLVHISEFSPERIESASDVIKKGDKVPVSIKESNNGKLSLSIKNTNPTFFDNVKKPEKQTRPRPINKDKNNRFRKKY